LHQAGITENLLKTRKMIKCPGCKFEFNLMYSRAIACQGCGYSVLGCNLVRCPKCDCEFYLNQTPLASNKTSSKLLSDYMSKILSDYFKEKF
jgi:hypothetical protein